MTSSRTAWADPGVEEVAPGVRRIPLPLPNDGLRAVNVYAVESPDGLVLVDSGWSVPDAREELRKALRHSGFSLADISRFLVTHVHRDHYTQAVAVRREFGTRVSLGADEEESLRMSMDPSRPFFARRDARLHAGGADAIVEELRRVGPPVAATSTQDWELPDDWLRDGQQVGLGDRRLDVVATPGHTIGHVVFVDDAGGLLFAGDHVLPQITPSISLESAVPTDPLGSFLNSLALVRTMPDRMLLPAHGPVTDSVHARVDELVAHHGARLDECEKAVASGLSTAYEVARRLHWTRRRHAFDDLDVFNRVMAVTETHAHLILLRSQGRLAERDIDGVVHYTVGAAA